jgi:hypothetical protein
MDNSIDRNIVTNRIKAEIFDLQIQYGKIKQEIETKLKELNDLNKKEE